MLAIYCRISKKKEEGKDTSIETQQSYGVAFADKHLMKYQIWADRGYSGQTEDRPAFQEIIKKIKKGKIKAVWVLDQSRLERNEAIWVMFQTLILQHDVTYYINGNKYDITDEGIRLAASIMSSVNASYARTTSKKVKDSYASRVTAGKWVGLTPYGYTTNEKGLLVIEKYEAKVVKRIFDLSLAGSGAYTIANLLNAENVPTKYNRYKGTISKVDAYTRTVKEFSKESIKWRGNVISDMIRNPIYKGQWITNSGKENEIIRDAPVIINEELYDRVIANLEKNKKSVGKRAEYHYLLNGLIRCDCGREMRGKKRLKGKDSAYKCGGGTSNCRGMNIAKLETFIIHHLFISKGLEEFLTNQPKSGDAVLNQLKSKFESRTVELRKIELKLKRLLMMSNDEDLKDDIDIKEEYKKAKKRKTELVETISNLEEEIYSIENNLATTRLSYVIANFTIDQPFDTIKRSVHTLVENIEVSFDSSKRTFNMQIKYKGFDEISVFEVDTMLMKWRWLVYQRAQAYSEQQLAYDRRQFVGYMAETFGIKTEPSNEWKGGITEPKFSEIILERDNLIRFD